MAKSKAEAHRSNCKDAIQEGRALAMDFDEVMRRVVRVKPEKLKKPAKRKSK
jgi:hypothetical protein